MGKTNNSRVKPLRQADRHRGLILDYAAPLATADKKRFLGLLGPSKIPQTILFSMPILLAGAMIAEILSEG